MLTDVDKVDATFTQMRAANIQPNEYTYTNVLKVYAKVRDYEKAQQLVDSMDTIGKDEDNQLKIQFSTLLIRSCPAEKLDQAVQLFESLSQPDWKVVNTMMLKYKEAKQYNKVYDLYEKIKTDGLKIDQTIFATLLATCQADGMTPKQDLIETIKKQMYKETYSAPRNTFDMHRIRRYWREMKEIYGYRHRDPVVKRSLKHILEIRNLHSAQALEEAAAIRATGKQRSKVVAEAEARAREAELERQQEKLQQQLKLQQAREKKKQMSTK
jgi:pentatricopeptide repeat protein